MHLESAETDLNLPAPPRAGTSTVTQDEAPGAAREGLPAAFKMRRERHYVEQLMGDAPLRTVREIPVAEIDAPESGEGEPADIEHLQQSIKAVGILQPLLVSQHGNRYAVIAGENRYRAATRLGLRTVPCLVCETSAHTVEALRQAATRRAAAPVVPELPMPGISDESRQSAPAAGLRDVTGRLAFVSAVMPALDAAGSDPLRWNILTDLMKVEMERARSTAAAIEWLSSSQTTLPIREPVDAAAIVDAVLEAVGPEARLQDVTLDIASTVSGYRLPADHAMMVRALIGLVQAMLALSPAGSTLRIDCRGTAVRPALIVSVTQEDCEFPEHAADRFFDAGWTQHPNGIPGALVLAGVAHVARLHGGRVQARAHEGRGCTTTLIIPRPLSDSGQ